LNCGQRLAGKQPVAGSRRSNAFVMMSRTAASTSRSVVSKAATPLAEQVDIGSLPSSNLALAPLARSSVGGFNDKRGLMVRSEGGRICCDFKWLSGSFKE
jgi:hypothetical protein